MVVHCSVRDCKSEYYPGCSITFHNFPKDTILKEKWLKVVPLNEDTTPHKICSKHFIESDFNIHGAKVKLNPNAIPSIADNSNSNLCKEELYEHVDESSDEEVQNEEDSKEAEVCRFCLATDVLMYSLEDEYIKTCLESVIGMNITPKIEVLPPYLCYECKANLLKCNEFIQKSMISEALLQDIIDKNGLITKNVIQQLDRQHLHLASMLTVRPTETFEYVHDGDMDTSVSKDDEFHEYNNENYHDDVEVKCGDEVMEYIYFNSNSNDSLYPDSYENSLYPDSYENNDAGDSENEFDMKNDYKDSEKTFDETKLKNVSHVKTPDSKNKKGKYKFDTNPRMEKYFDIMKLTLQEQIEEYENEKAEHAEQLKGDAFKCNICNRVFSALYSCENHVSHHDLKYGRFECCICKLRFQTNRKLTLHVRNAHEKKFSCKLCPKQFTNAVSARTHTRWHLKKTNRCTLCEYSSVTVNGIMLHMRREHASQTHSCTVCGKTFFTPKGLNWHMRFTHNDTDVKLDDSDGCYRCRECDLVFKTGKALFEHFSKCPIHKPKNRMQDFEFPATTCSHCGRDFDSVAQKEQHEQDAHQRSTDEDGGINDFPHICPAPLCPVTLHGRFERALHRLMCHRNNNGGIKMEDIAKAQETGRSGENLVSPISLITENGQVSGDHKESLPRARARLRARLKKAGTTAGNENAVTDLKSDKNIKFTCDTCGKGFKEKSRLRYHVVRHGPPKEPCPECGQRFHDADALRRHRVRHQPPKLACGQCGRAFRGKLSLARHTLVHTGEARYPCSLCNKMFRQKGNIKLHIRTVHMKLPHPPRKPRNRKRKQKDTKNKDEKSNPLG